MVYETPEIKELGSLEEIVLNSNCVGSDVPQGVPTSAYPIGGSSLFCEG